MTFTLATRSFVKLNEELDRCLLWLSDVGVDYFHTRIRQYTQDLKELIQVYERHDHNTPIDPDWFAKMVNSINEASRLVTIHNGLKDIIVSADLKNKLRVFIKGPEFALSENPKTGSQTPRDIAFELSIASVFNLAGFKIDFHNEADLRAILGDEIVYVECKRPRSSHSVRPNVKSAASQLRTRYKSSNGANRVSGIIALSVDKIINPNEQMLIANDENTMDSRLAQEAHSFVQQFHIHWTKISDQQTIGALIVIQLIAVPENRNIITNCRFLAASNIAPSNTVRGQLFMSIFQKLRPAIMGSQAAT